MSGKRGFAGLSPAMVVALVALFVALGGVGAVAGGVLTKTKVKKIAGNQVLRLAPGLSVANAAKASNASNADALGGAQLGSLTVGRAVNGVSCFPTHNSTNFATCGTVDLTLPRSGRVLVNAATAWHSDLSGVEGHCQIGVDGAAAPGTDTEYGQTTATFTTPARRAGLAINTVTGILGAGAHAFVLQCNDTAGNADFADGSLTAVMIGTD
jgi:hypothetical protein